MLLRRTNMNDNLLKNGMEAMNTIHWTKTTVAMGSCWLRVVIPKNSGYTGVRYMSTNVDGRNMS